MKIPKDYYHIFNKNNLAYDIINFIDVIMFSIQNNL